MATVTMTVNTQAASAIIPFVRRLLPGSRLRTYQIVVIWVVGMSFVFFVRQGSRRWSAAVALIVLAMIALAAGCGGGSSGPPPPPPNPGTPVGNYSGVTVTVTIGGVTESISNLSVNVQ
jgi:hypothetical protein